MPKKTSVRRTGTSANRNRPITEEDYERSKKQEMALADLANEVDKRIKAINYEAQQAVNHLQSIYSHCLNRLTQEEKSMLWVDFEAHQKRNMTAECVGGSSGTGNDGSGDLGTMAKKILNDINVVIPGDEVPPGDRRARRKRPAKAQKDDENEASDPKTRRIQMAAAIDDTAPAAAAIAAQSRPTQAAAAAVSDAIKMVPRVALTMTETPAHLGLQFKYLSATMGNTERRPKPLEKIALTSAATGSPLALEQRVCVLVDGQDVRNLKSDDISVQDIQYLQSVLASLQEKAGQQK